MSTSITLSHGDVTYSDTRDHYENAVLRLLGLTNDGFREWLALTSQSAGAELLERLQQGWAVLRPPPQHEHSGRVAGGPDGLVGRLQHGAIAEAPSYGLAVADDPVYAWLVRWDGQMYVREREPPVYEEDYFEGDRAQAGGYGDYAAQAPWRLEKAARQVGEMRARTGVTGGRVLDIGSGYGFFRVALRESGYEQHGIEISAFARQVAHATYDLETHPGPLRECPREWRSAFDAVTMFDVVEHLATPIDLLREVADLVRIGGVLGIKTPNMDCPEATVFGAHYHSLKREHLAYFSPGSLTDVAARAGFEPVDVRTASHLLVGFVGAAQTRTWEQHLQGADIVAWYRRTSD